VVEKKFSQRICEDEIDYSTIALCYVNIIAGAILSLGFKYAGTGNKEVFTLIADLISFYRKLKIVQPNKESVGTQHTNFTKNQIDKNTVETCLCVSALSLSIVMAGTGDTDCFRILRVLRKRFEMGYGNDGMHYGFNMAIHMSLGFLFLGSGAYTFSRNNLSIAALLCSLYPVFPNTPNDNRYHLQALRHFYVLAIETRLLQARDIDSGEFVNIQVDVEIEEKESGE
jgi:anaphase-promoting complex subunit 1